MSEAELFQLVVVDALRDFDAGEVLPLECIGQGGKNFQRRQSPAKGGRDAVQNAKCNDVKNIRFYCNDATLSEQ